MNIEKSTINKLRITDVERIDLLNVLYEDIEPGKGRVIIECYGKSWTSYWSAIGKNRKITQFFIDCNNEYLFDRFAARSDRLVEDIDAIIIKAKKHIIQLRKDASITEFNARELWEKALNIESVEQDYSVLNEIFEEDEDWNHDIPYKDSSDYVYLCKIFNVVREAFQKIINSNDFEQIVA